MFCNFKVWPIFSLPSLATLESKSSCYQLCYFDCTLVSVFSDPHVKVEGKKDDVLEAKRKILELLETKVSGMCDFQYFFPLVVILFCGMVSCFLFSNWHQVNKVTLKMDVTHTEHSHVIGKGGGNIKKVMEETSCHIHFPDSNRHSANGEKSNQVGEHYIFAPFRTKDLQFLVNITKNIEKKKNEVKGTICSS